eukprot:m.16639 g.16639  ORF g.16639 m.16639 type:complete len:320 (+) comp3520_c0_seq1:1097-2056(+)
MPKIKSPQDLVKKTRDAVEKVDDSKKTIDEANKQLDTLKAALVDDPASVDQTNQIMQEIQSADLLGLMVKKIDKIDFEGRKDIVQIFIKVLSRELGGRKPTVEYMATHTDILKTLCEGYENADIALHCGQMLRQCIRHEELAKIILRDEALFAQFFTYVQLSTFHIASDAFSTFKDLLTKHKILCADFLERNYDMVFEKYNELLNSENYVTRRQSLKLLGELLLDRANFTIMTKYISNADNLKLMMNMLREKSKNIQFEAFHVFKVFVANPNKSKEIQDILIKNRDKLVTFLTAFQQDRAEDEQFSEEKTYLIKQIKEL